MWGDRDGAGRNIEWNDTMLQNNCLWLLKLQSEIKE